MYKKSVHVLKSIVEIVVVCGKQNLPLRGHMDDKSSASSNRGNFWTIMEMMAKCNNTLREHVETGRKNAQYTLGIIQNEVIDVAAEYIIKEKTRSLEVENALFSIMADEVTYPHGNQEIMSVYLTTIPGTNPKISGTIYEESGTCRNVQDQMSRASHMLRHVL